MGEYTYEDIMFDPTLKKVDDCIGKVVYFSNSPTDCLNRANDDNENYCGTLHRINEGDSSPFVILSHDSDCPYRMAASIILKRESEPEYVPFESADEFLTAYLNKCDSVVKKDKANNEDVLSYHGIWLKHEYIDYYDYYSVTEIRNKVGLVIGSDTDATSWDRVLKIYEFLDGTPCGKIKK